VNLIFERLRPFYAALFGWCLETSREFAETFATLSFCAAWDLEILCGTATADHILRRDRGCAGL